MPHTFDTGLPAAQRTMVFDAIVTALADLRRDNGMYLRGVHMIARPVEKAMRETHDEMGIYLINNASQGNFPCALVAFGRASKRRIGTDPLDAVAELDVQVLICSANLGGLEAGRLTAGAAVATDLTIDPGMFVMVEHVEERLDGQALGVDGTYELRMSHDDEIDTLKEYSVRELRFDLQLDRTINPSRNDARVSLSIEADNQLDGIPAGAVGPHGNSLDPIVQTITDLEVPTP